MSNVNRVIILGRLTQDVDLKYTATSTAIANVNVATNERWTDKSGEKQEKTEFHRVVVFGKQAENCNQYLSKGSLAYIEGKLQTRSWEDKEGRKMWSTEINANTVQFIGGQTTTNKPKVEKEQSYDVQVDSDFTSETIPF